MKYHIPSRRAFLQTLGMAAATAVFNKQASVATEKRKRPNIVLVMADDQGWGDMAYNGHPVLKTPHFDSMAAEGLRFKDKGYYVAMPPPPYAHPRAVVC